MKLLVSFVIPLLIGNIFQQFYSIADVIIVGRTIGVNALAAVGAMAPFFMMLVVTTLGLTNGFTIVTGQLYGAGEPAQVRRSVAMSAALSVMAVVVLDIVIYLFLDDLLSLMNVPQEILTDAKSYITIIAQGLICMMAYNLLAGILRALGDSRTPLYFLIFSSLLNIVFALIFIIVFGWGVPGSALGTVMAQGVSALLCVFYIFKHFPILHLQRRDWHFDWPFAWAHLRLGLPMCLQFFGATLGMLIVQAIGNSFGPKVIAGFTAALRLEQLALQPMISFGLTMAVFTAQNFGARRFDRIHAGVKACSLLSIGFSLFAAIAIFLFSRELTTLFVDASNTEVIAYSQDYLHISVLFYFFLSQFFLYRGTIHGMGVSRIVMITAFLEPAIRCSWALYFVNSWGLAAVFRAGPAAWLLCSIFLFLSYHYCVRKFEREDTQLIK